jgi:hypothetical protein
MGWMCQEESRILWQEPVNTMVNFGLHRTPGISGVGEQLLDFKKVLGNGIN